MLPWNKHEQLVRKMLQGLLSPISMLPWVYTGMCKYIQNKTDHFFGILFFFKWLWYFFNVMYIVIDMVLYLWIKFLLSGWRTHFETELSFKRSIKGWFHIFFWCSYHESIMIHYQSIYTFLIILYEFYVLYE